MLGIVIIHNIENSGLNMKLQGNDRKSNQLIKFSHHSPKRYILLVRNLFGYIEINKRRLIESNVSSFSVHTYREL